MNIQDWIDKGYKTWPTNKTDINKLADIGLQKRIDDSKGKKYFITVYAYDWTNEPRMPTQGWHFMPTIQFSEDTFPTTDVTFHSENIEQIEAMADLFWKTLNYPYYEKWEE